MKFIILLLCFCSCESAIETSINLDEEDKTQLIVQLADMYFMDVFISRTGKDERDSVRTKMEDEFLQLHGQTVKEVDSYLDNLKNDRKLFTEVMDSVSNLLNTKSVDFRNRDSKNNK